MADDSQASTKAEPPSEAAEPSMGAAATAALLTVAGIVLVLLVGSFFTMKVCDTQLAQNSQPVDVCRHMQIGDPPVVLGALLVLAILAATTFSEVSAFGITLKGLFRRQRRSEQAQEELKKQQEQVEAQQKQLEQQQEQMKAQQKKQEQQQEQLVEQQARHDALVNRIEQMAAAAKENSEDLYERIKAKGAAEGSTGAAPGRAASIADLESRYDELRATKPSGPDRTAMMDEVYNEMRRQLTDDPDFDVRAHLSSPRRSERLAAYAFLFENPQPQVALELVNAVVAEDKPYGEYRGALTIERVINAYPIVRTPTMTDTLERRLRQLPPRTDRAQVIRRILDRRAGGT